MGEIHPIDACDEGEREKDCRDDRKTLHQAAHADIDLIPVDAYEREVSFHKVCHRLAMHLKFRMEGGEMVQHITEVITHACRDHGIFILQEFLDDVMLERDDPSHFAHLPLHMEESFHDPSRLPTKDALFNRIKLIIPDIEE